MFTLFLNLAKNAEKAIKAGMKAYEDTDGDVSPDQLTRVCLKETRGWHPKVKGKPVLTPSVRALLCRGLGALAYNIAATNAGQDPI